MDDRQTDDGQMDDRQTDDGQMDDRRTRSSVHQLLNLLWSWSVIGF